MRPRPTPRGRVPRTVGQMPAVVAGTWPQHPPWLTDVLWPGAQRDRLARWGRVARDSSAVPSGDAPTQLLPWSPASCRRCGQPRAATTGPPRDRSIDGAGVLGLVALAPFGRRSPAGVAATTGESLVDHLRAQIDPSITVRGRAVRPDARQPEAGAAAARSVGSHGRVRQGRRGTRSPASCSTPSSARSSTSPASSTGLRRPAGARLGRVRRRRVAGHQPVGVAAGGTADAARPCSRWPARSSAPADEWIGACADSSFVDRSASLGRRPRVGRPVVRRARRSARDDRRIALCAVARRLRAVEHPRRTPAPARVGLGAVRPAAPAGLRPAAPRVPGRARTAEAGRTAACGRCACRPARRPSSPNSTDADADCHFDWYLADLMCRYEHDAPTVACQALAARIELARRPAEHRRHLRHNEGAHPMNQAESSRGPSSEGRRSRRSPLVGRRASCPSPRDRVVAHAARLPHRRRAARRDDVAVQLPRPAPRRRPCPPGQGRALLRHQPDRLDVVVPVALPARPGEGAVQDDARPTSARARRTTCSTPWRRAHRRRAARREAHRDPARPHRARPFAVGARDGARLRDSCRSSRRCRPRTIGCRPGGAARAATRRRTATRTSTSRTSPAVSTRRRSSGCGSVFGRDRVHGHPGAAAVRRPGRRVRRDAWRSSACARSTRCTRCTTRAATRRSSRRSPTWLDDKFAASNERLVELLGADVRLPAWLMTTPPTRSPASAGAARSVWSAPAVSGVATIGTLLVANRALNGDRAPASSSSRSRCSPSPRDSARSASTPACSTGSRRCDRRSAARRSSVATCRHGHRGRACSRQWSCSRSPSRFADVWSPRATPPTRSSVLRADGDPAAVRRPVRGGVRCAAGVRPGAAGHRARPVRPAHRPGGGDGRRRRRRRRRHGHGVRVGAARSSARCVIAVVLAAASRRHVDTGAAATARSLPRASSGTTRRHAPSPASAQVLTQRLDVLLIAAHRHR